MTKTTVHALLIGIDAYRDDLTLTDGVSFPRLNACVSDAKKMQAWLEKDPALEVKTLPLHDSDATKSAIVEAFRTHLALAGPDDVALIYYSGHGTTERADPAVWTDQRSGRLETLACYFDTAHPPDFLLTDKELRFLLHELYEKTKAHIVAIFDCCHSGDNTRNLPGREIVEKRVDYSFPQRQWSEFLFADRLTPADFQGRPVSDVLPQGAHIQLAASESDEPASIVGGQSVFTAYLLDALRRSGGRLSYSDLHTRVRNRLRAVFEQKPKIYAPDDHRALLDGGFLKKDIADKGDGTLVFNAAKKAWILDRGASSGVEVVATQATAALPDGKTATGVVTAVNLDEAAVRFAAEDGAGLNTAQPYSVRLTGLRRETVRLRLVDAGAPPEAIETVADRLAGNTDLDRRLALEDDPQKADYDLVLSPDFYYLTRREEQYRPLVASVAATAPDAAGRLAGQLAYIADWLLINRLRNTGPTALSDDALEIQFFQIHPDGSETPLAVGPGQTLRIEYAATGDAEKPWAGKLRIVAFNRSGGNLYVLSCLQTPNFRSMTGLFEPPVKMIEQGKSETLREHRGGVLPFSLDDVAYWYNWPEENHTLKFVFSTLDFDAGNFEKAGLARPLTPDSKRTGGEDGEGDRALHRWGARNFQVIFRNPDFDQNLAGKAAGMIKFGEKTQEEVGDGSPAWFGAHLSG